jgi:putative membrane protein
LVPLLCGIFAAVLFFTRVVPLPTLIVTQPEPIYALFFGLVVGSIVVLLSGLGPFRLRDYVAFVAGATLGGIVVTAVPTQTPDTWWFVMLSGMCAICAMVVPGISGSFVLLILGKYAYVLDAIGHFKLAIVAPFALGALFGLVSFTRLLSWFMNRQGRLALLAIGGFLTASLWVIWPFQHRQYVEIRGKQRLLDADPIMPPFDGELLPIAAIIAAGFVTVIVVHWLANRAGQARW